MSDLVNELRAAVEKVRTTRVTIGGVERPYAPGELVLYVHPDDLAEWKATPYYSAETPNILATLMGVPVYANAFVPRGKVIAAPTREAIDREWAIAKAQLLGLELKL